MRRIIAIDCGTTNTRIALLEDNQMTCFASRPVGVRDCVTENSDKVLKDAINDSLKEIIEKTGIHLGNIQAVYASGMITSEIGLVTVPHISTPTEARTLANNLFVTNIEGLPFPQISFIPGVKNKINTKIQDIDMMRGEETEAIALINKYSCEKTSLIILPGSHTKFVIVDQHGQIQACHTSVTGEILDAITFHTSTSSTVENSFLAVEEYEPVNLLEGYMYAEKWGIGCGVFSARVRKTLCSRDTKYAKNFLLGAVLSSDVTVVKAIIKDYPVEQIILSGKVPLTPAIAHILSKLVKVNIVLDKNETDTPLFCLGVQLIDNIINFEG